jgi:hypothetical protein
VRLETNIDATIAQLEVAARQVPVVVEDAIAAGAAVAVDRLRDESPVDTGALRDGWAAERIEGGAAIVNPVEYAEFVDVDVAGAVPEDDITREIEAGVARLLGA